MLRLLKLRKTTTMPHIKENSLPSSTPKQTLHSPAINIKTSRDQKILIQNDLKRDSGKGNGTLMALAKCLGDHSLPKQNNNLQCGSLEISLMRRDREINY